MKTVSLYNSELQSIVIEALSSSIPCPWKNNQCPVDNIWFKDIHRKDNKLIFKSDVWMPLSKYIHANGVLNYSKVLRFVICMGIQLTALTEINYGFTHINLDDIMVINEDWFLLTNFDNISLLNKDGKINITTPFSSQKFTAPELKDIKTLPVDVDQSCSYYSIGMICLHLLGLEYNNNNMEKLYPSPLYFFLERCLYENPEKRAYLLI